MKKKIALIGYGALSHVFLDAFPDHLAQDYDIVGIWSRSILSQQAEVEASGYTIFESLEDLLASSADLVVEIAGVEAVKAYGEAVLQSNKDLLVTSVGALADSNFYQTLYQTARDRQSKVYLISGAVGGFDIFQSVSLMGEAEASIHTQKSPESLEGAPHLEGKPLPDQAAVVFEGSAAEAITAFPQNVNVAVASGLASVGCDQILTQIESVPGLQVNQHQIQVKNPLVQADLTVRSKPDPNNPKSSTVTAWSIVALLKNLASPIELF